MPPFAGVIVQLPCMVRAWYEYSLCVHYVMHPRGTAQSPDSMSSMVPQVSGGVAQPLECVESTCVGLPPPLAQAPPLCGNHYLVKLSFWNRQLDGFNCFFSFVWFCADAMCGHCLFSFKNHSLCVSCGPKCPFYTM